MHKLADAYVDGLDVMSDDISKLTLHMYHMISHVRDATLDTPHSHKINNR